MSRDGLADELGAGDSAPEPDPAASLEADPPLDADAPVDSTTPPTDPTEADQPPAVDPWAALAKDAAPLSYKQDGTAKTFDGILEVPGKGALIPADKLDAVRNMVARHESNAAATKDLYAFRQQVDGLGGVASSTS